MEDVTTAPDLGPFQDMWDAWVEARAELLDKPLSHFRRATDIQFDELVQHQEAGNHEAAAREATDIISVALNLMRSLRFTSADISEIARTRAGRRGRAEGGPAAPDLGPFQDMWDASDDARAELINKPLDHFRAATDSHYEEITRHVDAGDLKAAARAATDIIGVALDLMRSLGYTPADISEIARARAAHRMKGQARAILAKYWRLYEI